MTDVTDAHEHVANDACFGAMTAICGMDKEKQKIFIKTVMLCQDFDARDWTNIGRWLREQWHNGKPE